MTDLDLDAIAKRMVTQLSCVTAVPIFTVQQRIRDYGYDPDYSDDRVWLHADEPDEVTDPEEFEQDRPTLRTSSSSRDRRRLSDDS